VSQLNLSLLAIAEDLLPCMWPALVGFGGVQAVAVREVLAGNAPPPRSLVVVGSATVIGSCAAIALSIAHQVRSMPQAEPGFSYAGFLWSMFSTTMWPVVVALGVAELILILSANSSRWLILSAALGSSLAASWIAAWWLYVAPQNEVLLGLLVRNIWLLDVAACGVGFMLSTTTLLIGRRRALVIGLRSSDAL